MFYLYIFSGASHSIFGAHIEIPTKFESLVTKHIQGVALSTEFFPFSRFELATLTDETVPNNIELGQRSTNIYYFAIIIIFVKKILKKSDF